MKKYAGNIILHMRTKNHNHIMYGSRDVESDIQKFLLFWAIFCLLTLPLSPHTNDSESQNIEKNEKVAWRYHHFRHVYQKL